VRACKGELDLEDKMDKERLTALGAIETRLRRWAECQRQIADQSEESTVRRDADDLTAGADAIRDQAGALKDTARLDWYLSVTGDGAVMAEYLDGVRAGWNSSQWREWIDESMRSK
jgi:hypothetical protein